MVAIRGSVRGYLSEAASARCEAGALYYFRRSLEPACASFCFLSSFAMGTHHLPAQVLRTLNAIAGARSALNLEGYPEIASDTRLPIFEEHNLDRSCGAICQAARHFRNGSKPVTPNASK